MSFAVNETINTIFLPVELKEKNAFSATRSSFANIQFAKHLLPTRITGYYLVLLRERLEKKGKNTD